MRTTLLSLALAAAAAFAALPSHADEPGSKSFFNGNWGDVWRFAPVGSAAQLPRAMRELLDAAAVKPAAARTIDAAIRRRSRNTANG